MAESMIKYQKYLLKVVVVYFSDDTQLDGKLMAVSHANLVLSARGVSSVISGHNVIHLRPKRDKVVVRNLRTFGPLDDAVQHLVDRHGYYYSVAKVLTPNQSILVHNQMNHSDLGHRHVDDMPED